MYRIDDGWDCLAVLLLLGSGRAAAPQLSAIACIMIDEGALCARVLLLDVLLHAWRRVSRLCERVSEHTSDMWCAPGTRAEEAAYGGHGTAIDHPARTALLQPIAREQERVAGMGVSQAFMARVRATGASKPRTLAASRLQGVRIKSIIDRVDINLHLVLLELSSIRRSLEIRGQVLSEQTALLSCWCERQLMTLLMVRGDEANATKSTRKMRHIPGHSLYSFRGTGIRSLRSQLGRI